MNALIPLCMALLMACAPLMAMAAEDVGLSKQHAACMDKSEGITMKMIACINDEYQRQDARLNKAYKALMAELSPERKKQLLAVQRAWIKYRDANCNFYGDPDGGSLARIDANGCMLRSAASRANELEAFRE